MLDYFGDHFPDGESAQYPDFEAAMGKDFAAWGRDLAAGLEAGRSLPSLAELHDWQRAAKTIVGVAKSLWPDVVAQYIDGLDSKKDKRLIRGL
jgi:hypothetical protein